MPSEFALIDKYFKRSTRHTVLGVGDDGAIVQPTPGMELVVSTDMLVAGTHFLPDADPEALGWKVLAVNVSDLAAMGATPRWALLAAALPAATESWIERFARGFFACADAFEIDIIGGDTTRGPRNFCVTIFGEAPEGQALRRSGARVGDEIWVSGRPGRAALGLAHLQGRTTLSEPALTDCLTALHRPQPRVALGLALRGLATAAIDVSDGLPADLRHILQGSGIAAQLAPPDLPADDLERHCLLAGGDDYELVFTAPASRRQEIVALTSSLGLALTPIGTLVDGPSGTLTVLDNEQQPLQLDHFGYDHFC
jgi:thiamine-monophosphate kinase